MPKVQPRMLTLILSLLLLAPVASSVAVPGTRDAGGDRDEAHDWTDGTPIFDGAGCWAAEIDALRFSCPPEACDGSGPGLGWAGWRMPGFAVDNDYVATYRAEAPGDGPVRAHPGLFLRQLDHNSFIAMQPRQSIDQYGQPYAPGMTVTFVMKGVVVDQRHIAPMTTIAWLPISTEYTVVAYGSAYAVLEDGVLTYQFRIGGGWHGEVMPAASVRCEGTSVAPPPALAWRDLVVTDVDPLCGAFSCPD